MVVGACLGSGGGEKWLESGCYQGRAKRIFWCKREELSMFPKCSVWEE